MLSSPDTLRFLSTRHARLHNSDSMQQSKNRKRSVSATQSETELLSELDSHKLPRTDGSAHAPANVGPAANQNVEQGPAVAAAAHAAVATRAPVKSSTERNRVMRARDAHMKAEFNRRARERQAANPKIYASPQKNKMRAERIEDQPGRSPAKRKALLASHTNQRAPALLKQRHENASELTQKELIRRGLMSKDEFRSKSETIEFPGPPDPSNIEHAVKGAAAAMQAEDVVCAVCDCFVPVNTEHDVNFVEWTEHQLVNIPNAKEKLHHEHMYGLRELLPAHRRPLHIDVIHYYDQSLKFPQLQGYLLSPHKSAYSEMVAADGHKTAVLRVCLKFHCEQSLNNTASLLPPPFAISNHNATGALPLDLQKLTWPEAAITCRVYACARINVLKGGAQKALQGHITTVEQNNAAIAAQLPLSPDETTFRVVIAGALTPAQKLATFKVHQVRRDVILSLLHFYVANNHLYSDVEIDLDRLNKYSDSSSLIELQGDAIAESEAKMMDTPLPMGSAGHGAGGSAAGPSADSAVETVDNFLLRHVSAVEHSDSGEAPGADAGQPSVGGAWNDSFADSARHLLESAIPSVKSRGQRAAADGAAAAASGLPRPRPGPDDVLAIRCGSKFVPEDKRAFALMFPELFPYGRGGLDESRRTLLSLNRWVERLMHESSGRFGSPAFVLKVYNVLARGEAARKCFLRVQLGDMSFAGLTTQSVRDLVEYQLACSDAMRTHQELPDPPASLPQNARDLFRTMELCTGQMQHTDQYAKKFGRMRVFAMWNKFGPPALMLTLNPNDLASMLRLFYCGLQERDAAGTRIVPPAAVFSASLGEFPGAAALDFKRKLDIFIRHIIGYHLIDPNAKIKVAAPVATGGVYGPVLALFCAIEEQNRGSLHAHVLVWLPGVRPFSQLPARGADGWASLRTRISEYVQSIMTAQVQVPAFLVKCPREAQHVVNMEEDVAAAARFDVSGDIVRDTHIGQIPDVRPFRMPLKAKASAVGPPMIATCTRCDDKAEPKPRPFSVQTLTQDSIAHARATMLLAPVDPSNTSAFNQWTASSSPILFRAKPVFNERSDISDLASTEYLQYLVDIATVQVGCMSHDPAHRATCAKKGPQTECRFHFPFVPHAHDTPVVQFVNDEGAEWQAAAGGAPAGINIQLHRGGLSAYQNQTNIAVTGLYRCNNDVKFVQDPGSAFYITLYHVKTHDEERKQLLDMVTAVERAHNRQVAAHPASVLVGAPLVNQHSSSLQLALRAARAASSSSAISAPCAAYFLLGGERFISSEDFGYILLGSAEKYLRGHSKTMDAQLIAAAALDEEEQDISNAAPSESVPARAADDAVGVYAVTGLSDYECRAEELQALSWWEYEQQYERGPRPKTLKASNPEKGQFLFTTEHPMHGTRCSKRRGREVTPIVYGDRLPDSRPLHGVDADAAAQNTYAFRAMLLFAPFNTKTLRAPRTWALWLELNGTLSPCAQRVLANMQSYWEGATKKVSIPHLDAHAVDHTDEAGDADLENNGELEEQLRALAAAAEHDAPSTNATVQLLLQTGSLQQFPPPDIGNAEQIKASCTLRELAALKKSQFKVAADTQPSDSGSRTIEPQASPVAADALSLEGTTEPEASIPGRADWIKQAGAIGANVLESAPADVRHSIATICAVSQGVSSPNLKANAAANVLRHVIAKMELNRKQTLIFALLGQQFLAELFGVDLSQAEGAEMLFGKHTEAPVDLHPGSARGASATLQPIRAFLGGAAGTGKSRVIHAIKLLYQLCNKSSSLLITATTGVAAVALGACTVHSALNLMKSGPLSGPSQLRLRERLAPVTLLIVDEVSMLGTGGLADIEARLASVRPDSGKFGGISVLFVGDFCQFNPVGATPLSSSNASTQQWREDVTTVVMLDEQMRQAENPAFAAHLQAFREGRVTAHDVAYFNARFVSAASASRFDLAAASVADARAAAVASDNHYKNFVPIVVAENKDRVQVNNAVTLHLFNMKADAQDASVENTEFKEHFFSIVGAYDQTRSRDPDAKPLGLEGSHPANASDAAFIRESPLIALLGLQCTNKTDHMLRCFTGMEVVITDNLCVAMGVANGSRAFIVGLQLTERGALDAPVFDVHGMRQYSVRQVARVILHLLDASGNPVGTAVDGVLPAGQFGVFPFDDYDIMVELKKNKALRGHKFPLRYKRVQFPFVPAFGITAHKTQGLTMPKLILAATLNRLNKAPTDRYLYVVLSRLRSLAGLTLLQPLPHHSHSCYAQNANLVAELNRLDRLEQSTSSSVRAISLMQLLPPARVPAQLAAPSNPVASPPANESGAASQARPSAGRKRLHSTATAEPQPVAPAVDNDAPVPMEMCN